MNFSGEPSASVSGHLRRPPWKPPPPQGRSHHPLHRHVLRLANPQLFHRFPNPSSSFPVRSTMAGHVLLRSPADSALAAPPSAPTPRPHLTATPGRAHRNPDPSAPCVQEPARQPPPPATADWSPSGAVPAWPWGQDSHRATAGLHLAPLYQVHPSPIPSASSSSTLPVAYV